MFGKEAFYRLQHDTRMLLNYCRPADPLASIIGGLSLEEVKSIEVHFNTLETWADDHEITDPTIASHLSGLATEWHTYAQTAEKHARVIFKNEKNGKDFMSLVKRDTLGLRAKYLITYDRLVTKK